MHNVAHNMLSHLTYGNPRASANPSVPTVRNQQHYYFSAAVIVVIVAVVVATESKRALVQELMYLQPLLNSFHIKKTCARIRPTAAGVSQFTQTHRTQTTTAMREHTGARSTEAEKKITQHSNTQQNVVVVKSVGGRHWGHYRGRISKLNASNGINTHNRVYTCDGELAAMCDCAASKHWTTQRSKRWYYIVVRCVL